MNCYFMGFLDDTTLARFWSKIEIQPDGCWHYTGFLWDSGYPCFWFEGESWRATRFALTVFFGPPADGTKTLACHTCNNKQCCNPNHLYWGSGKDNYNDFVATGEGKRHLEATLFKRGHIAYGRKLAASQIGYIKDLIRAGYGDKQIAEWYGVTHPMVRMIREGKTYREVVSFNYPKVGLPIQLQSKDRKRRCNFQGAVAC